MALYDLDKTKPRPVSSESHSLSSLSYGHELTMPFHLYCLLKSPPSDSKKAKSVFKYLSTHVTDFAHLQLQTLERNSGNQGLFGSPAEDYSQVWRNIAANVHLLGHSLRRAMQRSAFTLGFRTVASLSPSLSTQTKQTFDGEDEKIEAAQPFVHVVALPGDVVIIDDSHSYSQFTTVIIACPQELTQLVKESSKIQRSVPQRTERSKEIRRLIHSKPHSSILEATAAASMENRNSMVLDLVHKGENDWFELASSIRKLILAHQNLSDSSFFIVMYNISNFDMVPYLVSRYAESLPKKVGDLNKFTPHITLTDHQHDGRILWLFDNNGCLKDLKWRKNFDWGPIYSLLSELCSDPRNEVWVTSGTNIENVEELYGHIKGLHFAKEHSVITKKTVGLDSIESQEAIQPDVPEITPLREAARQIYLEYKNAVIVGDPAPEDTSAEDVKKIERMHKRLFKLTEEKQFTDYGLLHQPDLGHLEFKHRNADKAHFPLDLLEEKHGYALAISVGDNIRWSTVPDSQ
ncbi:hypothetical protein MJO29_001904 [Puccinia striiformis f. sp. tritici]|nr:hypothetical protein MJO29_001904 [Puccinia striiformis f. sp. tritici]